MNIFEGVSFIVTSGRDVFAAASAAGYIESLAAFGITFVNDTCWCMLTEPIVPSECVALITNSAKLVLHTILSIYFTLLKNIKYFIFHSSRHDWKTLLS